MIFLSTTYWRLSQIPFPSILGSTQLLSHLSFWTLLKTILHLDTKCHYSPNNSVLTTTVSSIDKLSNPAALPGYYGAPAALPWNPAVFFWFELAGVSFASVVCFSRMLINFGCKDRSKYTLSWSTVKSQSCIFILFLQYIVND